MISREIQQNSNSMKDPKVSVIMAAYNTEKYIQESIESVVGQTFTDWELLIVDDGSSDSTPEIINKFCEKYSNKIHGFFIKNSGPANARNYAIEKAKGSYIAVLDSDDIALPERFERQVQVLDENLDIGLVSGNYAGMDCKGNHIGYIKIRKNNSAFIAWKLAFYNSIGGHSLVMYRKKIIDKLAGYNTDFTYSHDYELFTRISRMAKVYMLPEVLMKYRVRDSNITNTKREEQRVFSYQSSLELLSELISGANLSINDIKDLFHFWKHKYYLIENPNRVIKIIKDAYRGFKNSKIKFTRKDYSEIREDIAMHYFSWQRDVSLKGDISFSIKILKESFYWRPQWPIKKLCKKIMASLSGRG